MADAGKSPPSFPRHPPHVLYFQAFSRAPLPTRIAASQTRSSNSSNQSSFPLSLIQRYYLSLSRQYLVKQTYLSQVDMRKVNLQVIRPWVAKKVVELVGFEDEVLIEYAMGLLEDESKPVNNLSYFPTNTFIDIVFRHRILKKCKST
jgi:hypothetical protein